MTISSLKELDKLMLLCRKRGIEAIEIDGIKFNIDLSKNDSPIRKAKQPQASTHDSHFDPIVPDIDIPDQMTEEQMLFGSSDPTVWDQAKKA